MKKKNESMFAVSIWKFVIFCTNFEMLRAIKMFYKE